MGKRNNDEDVVLTEILNFLLAKYKPAEDIKSATLLKTTNEIIESINLFYPESFIGAKRLHALLTGAGFKYDCVDDMQFVWLIKE